MIGLFALARMGSGRKVSGAELARIAAYSAVRHGGYASPRSQARAIPSASASPRKPARQDAAYARGFERGAAIRRALTGR